MRGNIRILTEHLASKGIPLGRIAACVRDLGFLLGEKPGATLQEIDHDMRRKGWETFRSDEKTRVFMLLILAEALMEAEPRKALWGQNAFRFFVPDVSAPETETCCS